MRGLHVLLPTFATDYAGVCSTLYELGGLVVVLGPSGCANNVIAHDEPRRTCLPSRMFGADIDDLEATLGPDERIVEDACATWQRVGGAFVAIVGTPASMVIGTDHEALAREIGGRCGIPALAFATSGTQPYPAGIAQALLEVARTLVWPDGGAGQAARTAPGAPRSVNLLGATPLDLSEQASIEDTRELLKAAGWHVASCWCMGSSLAELRDAAFAQVNVVLTASALPLARWMRNELGIPYVWGLLSGKKATQATLAYLERIVSDATNDPVPPSSPASPDAPRDRALIVADQVLAESLRRALELDLGYARVDVATPFPTDEPPLRPGDTLDADEQTLASLVRSGAYDLIVGDPSLAYLAQDPASRKTRFLPVPCVGISGRLPHPDAVRPYGVGLLQAATAGGLSARDLIAHDRR